jgi:hypothetical protein
VSTHSIVHYGVDPCVRIPILQHFGFGVTECGSLPDFTQLVRSVPVDAVLFPEPPTHRLVNTIHEISTAPLICFASDLTLDWDHSLDLLDHDLDLVIAPMTRPCEWILSFQEILERSRVIRAESAALRAQSAAVRARVRKTIEASKHHRSRRV